MIVALGFGTCMVAIVVAIYIIRTTKYIAVASLQLVSAVVFVVIGMVWLHVEEASNWGGTPVLVASSGLLIASIAVLLGRRQPIPKVVAPPNGDRADLFARVTVSVVVLMVSTSYFVLLGYVPIFTGLEQLVSSGGVVTPGLTNSARVSRDIYVNPDAAYIPMQGLLEMFRYFGCGTAAVIGLDMALRHDRRITGYIILAFAIGLVVATGQRWPLMYLLACIAIYLSLTSTAGRAVWFRLLSITLVAAGVLTVLLGRTSDNITSLAGGLLFAFGDLFERVFVGYVLIPFWSYGVSRELLLPEGGLTWFQNLRAFLPGPGESYPVTFYQVVSGDDIGFTAAPDLWTEGWINLGGLGVLLSSLVMVGLARAIDWVLYRSAKSRNRAAVIALVLPVGVSTAFIPFSGLVFCLGAILVASILTVVYLAARLIVQDRSYAGESGANRFGYGRRHFDSARPRAHG